jgi:hypothetical protein
MIFLHLDSHQCKIVAEKILTFHPFIPLPQPYEIREYLEGQWACVGYSSNVPQTSDEYFIQTYDYARHAHYQILNNYTKGDNVESKSHLSNQRDVSLKFTISFTNRF